MRIPLFLLALAANAFSLTNQDLVGTWKAEGLDGAGSIMEIWYAADGSREMRSLANYGDLGDYRFDILGTWQLTTATVTEKTTGGWSSSQGSTDPVQPDAGSTSSTATLVAGSPKKLQLKHCDSPSYCTTNEFTFVAATKQFSLPVLNGTTSIRTASGRFGLRVIASGGTGIRFVRDNRVFDVKGRLLSAPPALFGPGPIANPSRR